MIVRQISPRTEAVELDDVLRTLRSPSAVSEPFSDEIVEFCHAFSRRLFTDNTAKAYPELQTLAFRMRRSELSTLRSEFRELNRGRVRLVPRGLVFHIPPANVDTISIYSWLLAVLTGNASIVRVSPRASAQTEILWRLLNAGLAEAPAMARGTAMIGYGHETEITAAISQVCDIRVIWGGDATVNAIRAIPLSPFGRDLSFPDRYSLCAIKASAFHELDEASRRDLAARFFNDTFWFNQMACSSPRLIVWCGSPEDDRRASAAFGILVGEHAMAQRRVAEPAVRIAKFTFACGAIIDEPINAFYNHGNEFSVLEMERPAALNRAQCGGGLVYQVFAPGLSAIAPFVERRDQTLTHFGFDPAELENFLKELNGCGIDRLVPIGQALSFQRHWDGMDLFQELTRQVYLEPVPPRGFVANRGGDSGLAHVG
jgi:hypothetical protein